MEEEYNEYNDGMMIFETDCCIPYNDSNNVNVEENKGEFKNGKNIGIG